VAAGEPAGAPLARVVVLARTHPLAETAREYGRGTRWFHRECLEEALGLSLESRAGADALAAGGLALLRMDRPMVELRAADPRLARLVNRARLGPQQRGYDVRTVLEAVLGLPRRAKRRTVVTDSRRQRAAEVLRREWGIESEGGPHVRLHSRWTWQAPASTALTVIPGERGA
jgi:hypothetical protein